MACLPVSRVTRLNGCYHDQLVMLILFCVSAGSFAKPLGGDQRGADDLGIAGATAHVAAQRLAQLDLSRIGVFLQVVVQRGQESRRTEPALQGKVFVEGLLKNAETSVRVGQPFDGCLLYTSPSPRD